MVLWASFLTMALSELTKLGGSLDPMLWLAQVLTPIALLGLLGLAAWNLWLVWKGKRGWFAKLWSVLVLIASIMLLWVALGFDLIGFGTHY